jgi:hypothetical protein
MRTAQIQQVGALTIGEQAEVANAHVHALKQSAASTCGSAGRSPRGEGRVRLQR